MLSQNTQARPPARLLIAKASAGIFGGAELATVDMAFVLSEAGFDVTLMTNDVKIIHEAQVRKIKHKKVHLPAIGDSQYSKLLQPLYWLVFRFLGAPRSYDCIITNSRVDLVAFTLLKVFHGKPVLHQDHGDIIHLLKIERDSWFAKLNQIVLLTSLRKANRVFFLNTEHRKRVLTIARQLNNPIEVKKTKVLRTGILFRSYELQSTKALRKSNTKTVLTFIGRLDETKGAHLLPMLVKKLSSDTVEFWIVGEGPLENTLRKSGARLLGFRKDISKILYQSDIFIQPSIEEGWGRTVEEAMLFGKPVVGSDIGGIKKQIEHGRNGLLFASGNSQDLYAKINTLIHDKQLRLKLGAAARKSVIKRGDYQDVVNSLLIPEITKAIDSTVD